MNFSFNLMDQEQVEISDNESLLLWNNKKENVCTVITNFRFIIYYDSNKKDSVREFMRIAKAVGYLPCYEILFEVNKGEIEEVLKEEEFDKYILKNGDYFYLSSQKIYNYFKQ